MLRSVKEIIGYRIEATDGPLGHARDFLFDDHSWAIRYLTVESGGWLTGRQVLLSPLVISQPQWSQAILPVALTREKVANSPGIESHQPVSRQHEEQLAIYYDWAPYWISPLGVPMTGMILPIGTVPRTGTEVAKPTTGDPHLRSIKEVTGYHIHATDGEVGHVTDFLVQTDGWVLRYMIVDTRNWIPGRKVLVSPAWVTSVDWPDREVRVDLTREQIRHSTHFDPSTPINREYEIRLYDYYGRPKYWEE